MHDQPDNIGKLVAFADDFTVAGILTDLKSYRTYFAILGQSLEATWKLLNLGLMSQKAIWAMKLDQLSLRMSTLIIKKETW